MSRVLRFDSKGEPFLGDPPSNVISFHPPKSDLILLFEVVDEEGTPTWGGESPEYCIQWLNLSPANHRVLVSAWDSEAEDAHLVGQSLDITDIIRYASL